MTCEDCIHFKKIEYPKGVHLPKDDKLRTHGYCDIERVRGWIKPNDAECELFELPADYGHDMARFNAYCETYNNAIKQCWESISK